MHNKTLAILFFALLLTACGTKKEAGLEGATLPAGEGATAPTAKAEDDLLKVDEDGISRFDNEVLTTELARAQKAVLAEAEKTGIAFMLEEEKLARDVYAKFFEKWSLVLFDTISASEHNHVNAIQTLAEKHGVDISFYKNDMGQFTNPHLLGLFSELSRRGELSLVEALKVAAEIEELDIVDLRRYRAETSNPDIILVYENLERASRNHLRAFVRQILREQGSYEPKSLSEDEFQTIVSSQPERGRQ
jgi:hypothetical protein